MGLVPNEALVDAAVWYMQMDQLSPTGVGNPSFQQSSQPSAEVEGDDPTTFLDELASGEPTPGGGSASAYGAAMAAKPGGNGWTVDGGETNMQTWESEMWTLIDEAMTLQGAMKIAVDEDAAAFKAYMQPPAYHARPTKKAERIRAIQAASVQAAKVPLQVARGAFEICNWRSKRWSFGNVNAISDGVQQPSSPGQPSMARG